MTTYTQSIRTGATPKSPEADYVNAVMAAATRVSADIREDDGTDPDLDDAIEAVYAFAFDMASAVRRAVDLHQLVACHIDDEHRAELRDLLQRAGAL